MGKTVIFSVHTIITESDLLLSGLAIRGTIIIMVLKSVHITVTCDLKFTGHKVP